MKKTIAITGGIGSGKSSALKILDDNGYKTISCDGIVSELYKKHGVKKILKSIFPTAVSGKLFLKIDRKEIAKLAFNDKNLLKRLTDTITPLVLDCVLKRVKSVDGLVFVEVPLLFECNYQARFDHVIIITRNKQARIDSVKTRSNLSNQEIIDRMNSQFDYDNNDLSSYTVINNDNDVSALKEQILAFAKNL